MFDIHCLEMSQTRNSNKISLDNSFSYQWELTFFICLFLVSRTGYSLSYKRIFFQGNHQSTG